MATTGVAAVAGGVVVVATGGGPGGAGAAPARTGAARAGRSEEGGVDDSLLVVGQADLLEEQHVVSPGKRGEDGGVGDVVGSVGEARVEATQEGEDELRVHGVADVAEGGGLDLQALAVCRDGVALHHGVELVEEEDGTWLCYDRHSLQPSQPS